MIISYDMYDIYMIYQPFEQLESLYLESKLITSKNFIGTYFGHMVTISDLGAGPQSRPLPLVLFQTSLTQSSLRQSTSRCLDQPVAMLGEPEQDSLVETH